MVEGVAIIPNKVTRGLKAICCLYGWAPDRLITLNIPNVTTLPSVRVNKVGSLTFAIKIPDAVPLGTYSIQASDPASGNLANQLFTITASIPLPIPLIAFRKYTVALYGYLDANTVNTDVIELINVGVQPANYYLYRQRKIGTSISTSSIKNGSLNPGESAIYSALAYQPTNNVEITWYVNSTAPNYSSFWTDIMRYNRFAGIVPPGTPATFTQVNQGDNLNNWPVINPPPPADPVFTSIAISEVNNKTGGTTTEELNVLATALDQSGQPFAAVVQLNLFSNGVFVKSAMTSGGTAHFPLQFADKGIYSVTIANNMQNASPIRSVPLQFTIIETPPTGCGAGFHNDGTGHCVPDNVPPYCSTGYHDNGQGLCIPDSAIPYCAPGYVAQGNLCVKSNPNPSPLNNKLLLAVVGGVGAAGVGAAAVVASKKKKKHQQHHQQHHSR